MMLYVRTTHEKIKLSENWPEFPNSTIFSPVILLNSRFWLKNDKKLKWNFKSIDLKMCLIDEN